MDSTALGHALRDALKQVYRTWKLEAIPVPRFAC
jgi:hypothetical protein